MATSLETIRRITIRGTTEGVNEATAALNKLATAQGNVAVVSDRASKASLDVSRKYDATRRSLDLSYRAAQDFEKAQRTVNLAQQQGVGTAEEHNRLMQLAAQRYVQTAAAGAQLGKSTGLARHELINLSRQIQDVGVSLQAGQNPLTILVQQGSQIADVFASSGGTVRGFFGQVAAGAARFLTFTTVAVGGTVALTAAAAALALQWDKVQKSAERALIGAGQRTGTTISDINTFAGQNSSSTGLSSKEARAFGQELTQTGDIVIGRLRGMGDAVVGFARLTDKSMEDARKDIVKFATDPVKALDELSKTYGGFDIATRKAVSALAMAGDKTGAFQVIVDALSESNTKAAGTVGFLEREWRRFVNLLAAPIVKPSGIEDQLAGATARLAEAKSGPFQGMLGQENIKRLQAEVDRLQASLDKVNADNAAAAIRNISQQADASVQSLTPQIEQIKKLEEAMTQLEAAKFAGTSSKFGSEADTAALLAAQNQVTALREAQAEAARYNQNIAAVSQQWASVSQSTALALQQHQTMLPVVQAVTGAQQQAAQYAADYANALAMGKSEADALAIATMNIEKAQASATASVMQQVEALKDQNRMILAAQNGTEAMTAAAIAYKIAIAAGADATAAAAMRSATLENSLLRAASSSEKIRAGGGTTWDYDDGYNDEGHRRDTLPGMPKSREVSSFEPDVMKMSKRGGGWQVDPSIGRNNDVAAMFITGAAILMQKSMYDFSEQMRSMTSAQAQFLSGSSSKEDKIRGLELQMQAASMDLMRDPAKIWEIKSLQRSIDQLKNSTDDLNSTMSVSLNPLYNGRDALKIGYYKAATGLDMIAQGPTSGDQVPFQAMVNGGERIQITPAGQSTANDNSKTVITNITNNFVGGESRTRLSMRQAAQGFGQTLAAVGG